MITETVETHFSEIYFNTKFAFKKMHFKVSPNNGHFI